MNVGLAPEPRVDVSVVMSTYNRASLLRSAVEALIGQAGEVAYEVIVVDNNSTDQTKQVVQQYADRNPTKVRYVFEPAQGLSHGRNAGIQAARGDLIAFTDDDVEVAPDWVGRLKQAFEEHPWAGYVGGQVLPRWTAPPPRWLTTAHWSPLALQDRGSQPIRVGPFLPVCLVGANLAFRRTVFDRVGLFTPDFGRIRDGIGSTEDHDMQLRLWREGVEGVYVPEVRMVADIPPDRMQRGYHRRWHRGHGRHCARMRLREYVPEEFAPMGRPPDLLMLFGVPAFVYLEVPKTIRKWAGAFLARRDSFFYANRLRHLVTYIVESWRLQRPTRAAAIQEVWRFLVSYARKASNRLRNRSFQSTIGS